MTDQVEADLQRLVGIVADLWEELPAFFGADWVDTVSRISRIVSQLHRTEQAAQRALLVHDLAMIFRDHPTVSRILQQSAGTTRGARDRRPKDRVNAIDELRRHVNDEASTRYTEIFAPRLLHPGERGVLTVRLTRSALAAHVDPTCLDVDGVHAFELSVHSSSPHLIVEDPSVRQLVVNVSTDGESVVFPIQGIAECQAVLTVNIAHRGVAVASTAAPVEVTAEHHETKDPQAAPRAQVTPTRLEGADLELRIMETIRDGSSHLHFILHAPNTRAGFFYLPAGEVRLRGTPKDVQHRLRSELEATPGNRGALRQQAVGRKMYAELLPAEFRRVYRDLARGGVRTMQITSDEPWIPWELIRPYDDDGPGPIINEDHWCVQYDVTRWLAGALGPPATVTARSLAVLAAPSPPGVVSLPSVSAECEHLRRLAKRAGMTDLTPNRVDAASVDELLDRKAGSVGILHFAGHGSGSALLLSDGSWLQPDELTGPRQTVLRSRRPLVFLNACRAAELEHAWTGLSGWAQAWSGQCRSVFVAPLWSVRDEPATFLSTYFYDRLVAGARIGAAMTAARQATRQRWPNDFTWLAYSVYAHPDTAVIFASGAG